MSRSAIYTANQNNQIISNGGVLNLGTVIRRFGANLQLSGNAIQVIGNGYYKINVSITCAPEAIGTVTATLLKDGLPVQGGTASEQVSAANTVINLSFPAIIREPGCNSYYPPASNLTVQLSGVASTAVTNVGVTVDKL